MKKMTAALMLSLQLLWGVPAGKAEAITQKPEELRIPPVILLLEDTPFYDSVEKDYPNHPAGMISPQDVQVLEGQNGWVNERNRWKIHTWLGDKWIVTEPGTFDVPPPQKVTLMKATPIYGSPNAKNDPTAVLTPQDVQVVGAEKQWFRVRDINDSVWLKISTSWLGDQWIHIPLSEVGYASRADFKTYLTYADVYDGPPIRYLSPMQVGKVENRYAHVVGTYITAFGKAYRIETDIGEKWVNEPGIEVQPAQEDITLTTDVPLFDSFLDRAAQVSILQPQTVTAFEKVDFGYGPYNTNVWYHVRTAQGEGWINRSLGEPENSVPITLDVRLHGQTTIYSYPNERMKRAYDPLAAQTVRVDAYWNDAMGNTWLRTHSYVGKVWFSIDPRFDKLTVPDGKPRLQMAFQTLNALSYVQSGESLADYNGKPVGFVRDGVQYLSVTQAAESLRYKVSGPDPDGAVTLTPETRYAFQLKAGTDTAVTLWNGHRERTVKLHEAPQSVDGSLYLRGEDIQTMFGASLTKDDVAPVFFLAAKVYTIEAPEMPAQASVNVPLELKAYAFDQVRKGETVQPQLYLYRRGTETDMEPLSTRLDTGMYFAGSTLHELTASSPLLPGSNELTAAVKIGERIVWQQEVTVNGK